METRTTAVEAKKEGRIAKGVKNTLVGIVNNTPLAVVALVTGRAADIISTWYVINNNMFKEANPVLNELIIQTTVEQALGMNGVGVTGICFAAAYIGNKWGREGENPLRWKLGNGVILYGVSILSYAAVAYNLMKAVQ